MRMRTSVIFESAEFNTSEPRAYFLNPRSFGDDVARWIADELARRGIAVEGEPGQEDFGWYLRFNADGVEHCFVVGFRPDGSGGPSGQWIGTVERSRGLLSSLLGRRRAGVSAAALMAIHGVISTSPAVRNVSWHFDDDLSSGREDRGRSTPDEP